MNGLIFLAVPLFLVSEYANATEVVVPCPLIIETTQRPSTTINGWEFDTEEIPSKLESIRLSEGHPKDMAWLMPDKIEKKSQTWVLEKSKQGYWVTCGYSNSKIILTRKIESNKSTCVVVFEDGRTPPTPTKYSCQ